MYRGSSDEPHEQGADDVGTLSGSETEGSVDVSIGELVDGGYAVDVHLPARNGASQEVIACGELADASQSAG